VWKGFTGEFDLLISASPTLAEWRPQTSSFTFLSHQMRTHTHARARAHALTVPTSSRYVVLWGKGTCGLRACL
jgi:hypothetical protein